MDKLKYIKLENEDGSYSSSIPLAVDSDYVDVGGDTLTNKLIEKAEASDLNILTSRVDNLAHLEEGSTTGDAELIDARIGYNGRSYTSLGDGTRRQISGLTKGVNDLLLGKKYLTYPFVNGNANSQGIYSANKYRIRTKNKVLISELTTLECNAEFRIVVVKYASQEATKGTETSGIQVTIQPNSLVHITIKRSVDDTSEIADIDEFLYNAWIKDNTINDLHDDITAVGAIGKRSILSDEAKSSVVLEGTYYTGLFSQRSLTGNSQYTDYNYLIIDNIPDNYKNKVVAVTGYIPTNQLDYGLAICIDENNQLLYTTNSENLSPSAGYSRFSIPIAKEVSKIVINGKANSTSEFYAKCEYIIWDQEKPLLDIKNDIADLQTKVDKTYDLDIADALLREAKKNPFELSAFDKGYITFVWDDGRQDLDKVAAIFEEYNFPIGAAMIPSKLTSICNGLSQDSGSYTVGMTVKEVSDKIVELGGEIMSHNSAVVNITNQYDYDFMYNYFVKTKRTLENNGYNIRGIIRAGGDGAISHTPQIERWLIGNYEYSNIGTAINYAQDRVNIGQGVAYMKTQIDNAIANNGWCKVMCHGLADETGSLAVSETDLRAILDYCVERNIAVVTYADIFDNFSSSKLLNNLNN